MFLGIALNVPEILLFILVGALGGLTYVFMIAESWDEFKEFNSHKRLILGGIIGFIYFYLHSDWGYPNAVMTWVSGYMGPTFVDQLIEKRKKVATKSP